MTKRHRAFLKWAGGKAHLLQKIEQALPQERTLLIEPFVGAGTLFLNSHYTRYQLSDINADLIALYQIVKKKPRQFIRDARQFFQPSTNHALYYYACRELFNQSSNTYDKALRFLYLNRHGYNGLCRYNQQGQFNVPFGAIERPYFPEQEILYFSEKAKNARFSCEPFHAVFARLGKTPNSTIYCDPPYTQRNQTSHFTRYHLSPFTTEDQRTLATLATQAAAQHACSVLISNHDTPEARIWYANADEITLFDARRRISCRAKNRRDVAELLAYYGPLLNIKKENPS